ncbi:phosphoglucomutase (alpha-D-glucose-1,6-bisphosphate-dependent) [Pseudomonas sp. 5P_3.1_Bac2]|uniref:phosphoglucomutase (alpha-D-glucose-1,6-bisphosphate-dependent) n=1 Tax=Pseudomonas sp. 5P_3.1_Bac2 TaxID=2971617 RepID=UPI0021C9D6A5|nr:phosphoglucomutase (alpha-D-glucose-1,6-bisphosphate-dependent) [Pseudomonas sp. 5P_3.1_Bac2]MCU1716389.1 phosphoglucomutase (alpha-D-glucose-1,6-bisphosphate-dependent) [Pseudomonas sp. 5P_3.1_Bac2]
MSARIHPLAGQIAPAAMLTDIGQLLAAYYEQQPDPSIASQRVAFGTSGHRGSSLNASFNQQHVLAVTQAICDYRASQGISGPLFIGADSHALSQPALESALEVLAANGVTTMLSAGAEFTPTPAVSQAILVHNRGRSSALADGIVITPSHNPPDCGGFKYNPTNGGPADSDITTWVQNRANALLESALREVKRLPLAEARQAACVHEYDYLSHYVNDLDNVIDFAPIRAAGLRLGVDPLGGAGVHYWARIAEKYGLNLDVVSQVIDPQFAFMSLDWDGQIRMDPSSSYAMQRLIGLKDGYDIAFACDTDYDRHGIVAPSVGLLPANHFLSVAVDYLFQHRPQWSAQAAVGKTLVSSAMLDRVAARLGRPLLEVPVGFKWFAAGLFDGSLGFGGEESAGATFLRRNGQVWTTDKDGIALALLAAEMTAVTGRDPGQLYQGLSDEFGAIYADRQDAAATPAQKQALGKLSAAQVSNTELAGDAIVQVLDKAPGNGAGVGGIKVISEGGWFAARPSGTEDIYKIYAESFRDEAHLQRIFSEAQQLVNAAL